MAALFSCSQGGGRNIANDKNLIPNSERTPIEIKEMTSNGGKRSGEVRREKKLFQQAVLAALEAKGESGEYS